MPLYELPDGQLTDTQYIWQYPYGEYAYGLHGVRQEEIKKNPDSGGATTILLLMAGGIFLYYFIQQGVIPADKLAALFKKSGGDGGGIQILGRPKLPAPVHANISPAIPREPMPGESATLPGEPISNASFPDASFDWRNPWTHTDPTSGTTSTHDIINAYSFIIRQYHTKGYVNWQEVCRKLPECDADPNDTIESIQPYIQRGYSPAPLATYHDQYIHELRMINMLPVIGPPVNVRDL